MSILPISRRTPRNTLPVVERFRPGRWAFPFSPRPGTVGAILPNQIPRNISKERVHKITELADKNLQTYMAIQTGKIVSVLVENKNIGRTPDDIDIAIRGKKIPAKTICDVRIIDIKNGQFIGERVL